MIRELRPPQGYFLNDSPAEFAFTYDGQKEMVFEHTCRNKATTVDISKRELTGDEELPARRSPSRTRTEKRCASG